jgi:mono/diheme cytochrome c family protein
MGWTLAFWLCILAAARNVRAQEGASDSARTTLAGVFTAEQAARGRDLYAGVCVSCHNAASHTGVTFANSWGGRLLSELFMFVSEKMPKNEPGSLTPGEYAQAVAYILKMNGLPAGETELPTDTLALHKIRIETVRRKS